MIKIAICYFSGTGNTEYVARLIQEQLAGQTADLYRIEDLANNGVRIDLHSYDMLGIGSPCYGFNPARIVLDFAKSLPRSDALPVFLFLTCAGPCYMNDAALFGLKRILKRKGYRIVNERIFVMPANILIRYPDHIIGLLLDAAAKIAGQLAAEITDGRPRLRSDGFLPYFTHGLLRLLDAPLMRFSLWLDFHASRDCNQCRLCVDSCPRRNISLKRGHIRYGLNCEACYRCVYLCPRRAIRGRLFNWAIHKDGYDLEALIAAGHNQEPQPLSSLYKTLEPYLAAAEEQQKG